MSVHDIPEDIRVKDLFHHIDMGFLNRRLCITALPAETRKFYIERAKPGSDHMTALANDHLLVTMLLDVCEALKIPTLVETVLIRLTPKATTSSMAVRKEARHASRRPSPRRSPIPVLSA